MSDLTSSDDNIMSIPHITNTSTTNESTAEPLTPISPQDDSQPPLKKQKKKHDALAHLTYIAQWYTNLGDGQDGLSGPGIEANFGITSKRTTRSKRSKTFEQEMYDLQQQEHKRREILRVKREKELERLRRLAEIKAKKEKELLLKKQAELKKIKEAGRLERFKNSPTPNSISPTPEPEVEEFIDGYKPFSYSLEKDIEIPIREDFFIPEVYSNSINDVTEVKFRSAYELITSNKLKYYKKIKNFEPKIVKFKSVIFPEIFEEYYSVQAVSDLQLDPFEEMGKLMELSALNYFPDVDKKRIYDPLNPYSSLVGKYSKALQNKKYHSAISKIHQFNSIVRDIQKENGFVKHLIAKKTISRVFIHEILNEIYSRSVSPKVNLLKKYQAFSSNVYGELLPKFLSQVFDKVGLNSKSRFIDLGSGVGNVTIQAALEYGCESYGCEVMENCSELGDLQLVEFEERSKFFGLNPGKVKFFHRQSFIDNPQVKEIIDDCDVILVNNFLFTPDLKEKTLRLFNNLKPKTKIISLRTILPDSHHIEFDDVDNFVNKFEVCKYEFEPNSVSWTAKGGVFYISEFTGLISERSLSVFNTRARERNLIINKTFV